MTDVKLHRIIRHGTAYGPPLPEGVFDDDGQARGIFFIFLSATAPDTYEFLKKEWINDGNFLGLGTERDPIVRIARRHAASSRFRCGRCAGRFRCSRASPGHWAASTDSCRA